MTKIMFSHDDRHSGGAAVPLLLTSEISPKHAAMTLNIGMSDRVLRMYLGMIVAGIGISANSVWAVLGIPIFLSGIIGLCPLYKLLRINSFGKADAEN